ncbi:MAG: hypothetical protein AAGB93_20625 [Planctomycetota bacterium]
MMRTTTNRTTALALTGALLFASAALSQEGEPPTPKQEEAPVKGKEPAKDEEKDEEVDIRDLNPFTPPGGSGPSGATELKDLFLQVEKRLNRVTELLYEASSGDVSEADGIGGAGIDELIREAESGAAGAQSGIARMLEATRGQSQATLDDIARILELAEQSGSGGSQPQSPPEPQDGMPQQGQTPSGSRKQDTGERPPESGKEGQDQQGQQEQGQNGDEPSGNQETEGGPDGPAKAPPEGETGDPAAAAGNEDWGDLPIHLRQVFQNGVSEDVPPRYRDWVDSYYKRLNRRSGGR